MPVNKNTVPKTNAELFRHDPSNETFCVDLENEYRFFVIYTVFQKKPYTTNTLKYF